MTKTVNKLSAKLYSIGLVATAVLMPLDLITQGGLRVEWLILLLLLQRFVWVLFTQKPFLDNTKSMVKNAMPFALPVLAIIFSAVLLSNRALAIPYMVVLVGLIGRSWIIGFFTSLSDVHLFEKATLIMTALLVVFGYFQFFGDIVGLPPTFTALLSQYRSFTAFPFPRVHSLSLEPLYFSNYLLLPLAILAVRLRRNPTRRRQWQYSLLFVAALALLISSVSRSAILGLIVSSIIYALVIRKDTTYLKRMASLGVITLVLVAGLVYSVKVVPKIQFKSRANQALSIFGTHITNLNEDSAKTRYDLWPRAVKLFSEQPITGVGLNGSRGALHPDEVQQKKYDALQPINNDYLVILSEQGLLGIVSFIPLVWVLFKIILKTIKDKYLNLSAAYVITLIAVAVQVNSFGGMLLLRTWVVIGMAIATYRLSIAESKPTKRRP